MAVTLDDNDAAFIAGVLYRLADLVHSEVDVGATLDDVQVSLLTSPPALAITRDRPWFASRMRHSAALIEGQLSPSAPMITGPAGEPTT